MTFFYCNIIFARKTIIHQNREEHALKNFLFCRDYRKIISKNCTHEIWHLTWGKNCFDTHTKIHVLNAVNFANFHFHKALVIVTKRVEFICGLKHFFDFFFSFIFFLNYFFFWKIFPRNKIKNFKNFFSRLELFSPILIYQQL